MQSEHQQEIDNTKGQAVFADPLPETPHQLRYEVPDSVFGNHIASRNPAAWPECLLLLAQEVLSF